MKVSFNAVSVITPLLAVCAFALPNPAQAQVTVNETISSAGSLFQYNYAVTDNTPDDLLVLTLGNLPTGPNAVQNFAYPAGFQATYDSVNNLVSFLAAPNSLSVFPAGTTTSGFSFQSPFLPVGTTFETLDINGGLVDGRVISGRAVPEPGAFPLVCGVLVAGLAFRRSRRTIRRNRTALCA